MCVVWNLQGIRTVSAAKRRLLSPSNKNVLGKLDWNRIKNISTCHEVIESFCYAYEKPSDKKTILLLVDEPDTFLHFVESKEYDFLTELKQTFETMPNLRVVIVSPPRIQKLFRYKQVPCLLDHFQIYFLNEFNETDAKKLIQLKKIETSIQIKFLGNGKQVISDILEISNRVPFYIQQICSAVFDAFPSQRPAQVIENIIEKLAFSSYFFSDFDALHPIQKIMLLHLANSQEPKKGQYLIDETKKLAPEINEQIPTLKHIDELIQLGILRKSRGDKYHCSNRLFERWILRDFANLWNQTMKKIDIQKDFDKKILTPEGLKKTDLDEIKANLIAFNKVLKDISKDYSDGKLSREFYYTRLLSMVRDNELMLMKLKNHLTSRGARSLAQVLEQISQEETDDKTINDGLNRAEKQGQTKGWGDIVLEIMNDNSISRVQAK